MRKYLKTALAAPAALASLPALAQTQTGRTGYWLDGWNWGWGHMMFGGFMMVAFWSGMVLLLMLAVRWLGSGPSHGASLPPLGKRAPDILQERFARGEIDKAEFEERKQSLSS